jgi:hypothetical protein
MSAATDARPDPATLTPAHLRAWRARADATAEGIFARHPWLRDVLEERLRAREERAAREEGAKR